MKNNLASTDLALLSATLECNQNNILMCQQILNKGWAVVNSDDSIIIYLCSKDFSVVHESIAFEKTIIGDANVRIVEAGSATMRTLGRALVGDFLLGEVGAIVGAASTKQKYDVYVAISSKLGVDDAKALPVGFSLSGNSKEYMSAVSGAQKIAEIFKNVVHENEVDNSSLPYSEANVLEIKRSVNVNESNWGTIISRIKEYILGKKWVYAKAYCEAALDFTQDNGELHALLFLVKHRFASFEDMFSSNKAFDHDNDYIKAVNCGYDQIKKYNDALKEKLYRQEVEKKIVAHCELARQAIEEKNYADAERDVNWVSDNYPESLVKEIGYYDNIVLLKDHISEQRIKNADEFKNICIQYLHTCKNIFDQINEKEQFPDKDELITWLNQRIDKLNALISQNEFTNLSDNEYNFLMEEKSVNKHSQLLLDGITDYINGDAGSSVSQLMKCKDTFPIDKIYGEASRIYKDNKSAKKKKMIKIGIIGIIFVLIFALWLSLRDDYYAKHAAETIRQYSTYTGSKYIEDGEEKGIPSKYKNGKTIKVAPGVTGKIYFMELSNNSLGAVWKSDRQDLTENQINKITNKLFGEGDTVTLNDGYSAKEVIFYRWNIYVSKGWDGDDRFSSSEDENCMFILVVPH